MILLGAAMVLFAACAGLPARGSQPMATSDQPPTVAPPPVLGRAAGFDQGEVWLNGPPLAMADLRGRVVLVVFWTFGCVNCQRLMPHVQAWQADYGADGLTVVAVHRPEFRYERDVDALQAFVRQNKIGVPVVVDGTGQIAAAYGQWDWPTLFVVDKGGNIRYKRIGEGAYAETTAAIELLLAEPPP